MQVNTIEWSTTEQVVAQTLFQRAYDREISALTTDIRRRADAANDADDLWILHDFLSARRHSIEGKYDFNYASLLFVLADLIKEGWLTTDELQGLDREKVAKVTSLAKL